MSSSIPNNLPTLEKLIRRISQAEKANQKEVRLSIQEARDLSNEMAILTANLGNTIGEIYTILKNIQDNTNKIDIKFDGGGF